MVFDKNLLFDENILDSDCAEKHIVIGDVKYNFSLTSAINYLNKIKEKLNVDNGLNESFNEYIEYLYGRLTDVFTIDELHGEMLTTVKDFYPIHYDYMKIASYITVKKIHANTCEDILETTRKLYYSIDPNNKDKSKQHYIHQVSKNYLEFVEKYATELNEMLDFSRDFDITYFGLETLKKSYLKSEIPKLDENGDEVENALGKKQIERPQHMWMRTAVGIHKKWNDLESIKETYEYMSRKYFTHATPTLFNAGSGTSQMASCFLIKLKDDSLEGIMETMKRAAKISKHGGGVAIYLSNLRARNSRIKSTQGKANGLKIARVLDALTDFFNQGGRSGSCAIYLEPWHADVEFFLNLRKNGGKEKERARDLFLALSINDLFMKCVDEDTNWYLMCPDECPGLCEVYGEEFDNLYQKYVSEGRYRKVIKARKLWWHILSVQIEQGLPYIVYKDAMNRKSNQKNLGTIVCSNLCTEIIEYTSPDEVAVCNLASICLPKCIVDGKFDFELLGKITRIITKNLNRIIDVNFYTEEETRSSNFKNRPIGIGVQGLADAFIMLGMPFDSEEAAKLNKDIFETIYYYAMDTSIELAKTDCPYDTFVGSPLSEGKLQFDLWAEFSEVKVTHSGRYDWDALKIKVKRYGARNSLLLAPMPTASTSQILGSNECFEPYTSNIYARQTSAGKFKVINEHLMKDLMKVGLWNKDMRDKIMAFDGSVQQIEEIPIEIRNVYKTSWDIKQTKLVDMAAERGIYIDQSQSLNIFIADPDYEKLSTIHFRGWKKGLKTGMYYLRSKPLIMAKQFNTGKKKANEISKNESIDAIGPVCTMKEGCVMCSS